MLHCRNIICSGLLGHLKVRGSDVSGWVTRGHDKMLSSDKLDKTKLLSCCWQKKTKTYTYPTLQRHQFGNQADSVHFPNAHFLTVFHWSGLMIFCTSWSLVSEVSEASCGRHTVQKYKKYWPYRASLSVQVSVNISVQLMERLIYKAWTLPRYWFVEFPLYWTFRGWGKKSRMWEKRLWREVQDYKKCATVTLLSVNMFSVCCKRGITNILNHLCVCVHHMETLSVTCWHHHHHHHQSCKVMFLTHVTFGILWGDLSISTLSVWSVKSRWMNRSTSEHLFSSLWKKLVRMGFVWSGRMLTQCYCVRFFPSFVWASTTLLMS